MRQRRNRTSGLLLALLLLAGSAFATTTTTTSSTSTSSSTSSSTSTSTSSSTSSSTSLPTAILRSQSGQLAKCTSGCGAGVLTNVIADGATRLDFRYTIGGSCTIEIDNCIIDDLVDCNTRNLWKQVASSSSSSDGTVVTIPDPSGLYRGNVTSCSGTYTVDYHYIFCVAR